MRLQDPAEMELPQHGSFGSLDDSGDASGDLDHPRSRPRSYMASLVPPSSQRFQHIAQVQAQKEEEIHRRDRERWRQSTPHSSHRGSNDDDDHERLKAAKLIQKTFRGHRSRREMDGLGLDASTRWVSALREAEFRQTTRPRPLGDMSSAASSLHEEEKDEVVHLSNAMRRWRMAAAVARRAGHDDAESDSSSASSDDSGIEPEEREQIRQKRDKILEERRSHAQMLGLQYFLEMVDERHRYGANLRVYHAEWKTSDTRENFFQWLDYGGGRSIELDSCPRDRLERERIRYLSREERQYYLVEVGDEGRLHWAKNGARIDTTDQFKDSIRGIVPLDDPTPTFHPGSQPAAASCLGGDVSSVRSSLESRREADRAAKYADPDPGYHDHNGLRKVKHFSASTLWNKLLRKSVKDGTWIFVADTSFRLYVGIKTSGAFQHSSFLQGGRISAAGLIKIRDGYITSLSPLSGHYRPPASNFRAFVKSLGEAGVDMSQATISKSYAVLVGMEMYSKTKRTGKHVVGKAVHGKSKNPNAMPREVASAHRRLGSKLPEKVSVGTSSVDAVPERAASGEPRVSSQGACV